MNVFEQPEYKARCEQYVNHANFPDFQMLHASRKTAGESSNDSITHVSSLAFQGTIMIDRRGTGQWEHTRGAGHLGESYVGCASVREGKGSRTEGALSGVRIM
jgi:hypothetical protein